MQYSNDVTGSVCESYVPQTLIVTDEETNLGFMDARAGMDFAEIQKSALPEEIQQRFMYFYEEPVYYSPSIRLRFTDIHSSLNRRMEADIGCW